MFLLDWVNLQMKTFYSVKIQNILEPSCGSCELIYACDKYFNNVKITNVQPDGSTIVKTLQVQGLAWDITPNSMKCTVTTLEPIVEGFIIGSSTYGIIGQSIMGY